MKIKVCGMKIENNIMDVATLPPDYMGFIFYEKSSRFFNAVIPELPESIKKIGVFVNASKAFILEKVKTHRLYGVQLHGEESPEFCADLQNDVDIIIKVFSMKNQFDFSVLEPYESVCNYYLFDTKGKNRGGNGYTFNWNLLKQYTSHKPYFLSGGIGLDELEAFLLFLRRPESIYCCTVDVNSKFETAAGLKDLAQLKTFKHELNINGYGVQH